MNDSMFNPEAFLDSTLPGANSTKREIPPMGVYNASISKIEVKGGTITKEGENYGKPWRALNLQWLIEDQPVNADLDQPRVIVYDSVFLDLDDSGQIAMGKGKNTKLGKLREAIGLNTGPVQFRAFEGRPAKISVGHEMYKDDMQAVVKSYAKA
jgi:hypothetical protein